MMFTSINRTVFEIPLTWDRTRFEASRNKCRQARKLVEISVNAQFNKQLKEVFFQKLDIEKNITDSQECLINHEKKIRAVDNLIDVASESLTDYFDKRMENVRIAIQEHCNAIQQILCEENEHWKEIHTAIDQNLITSDDIHRHNNIDQEIPLTNIHTINEVDEEEEHTTKLLNNKTVTPLITQMIRNSRLQSNRRSTIAPNIYTSIEKLIPTKDERFSVILPLTSARRTLPVIDTTFVVKVEESKTSESNELNHNEILSHESYHDEVIPIESIPITNVEITPSYSQPKPPARLYFSPTLLQDHEESEPIQNVLSNIDQNQTNIEKPKVVSRRFGQTFLLDNIKIEDNNKNEDRENLRPKISDEIPMIILSNPSILIQKQSLDESHHIENSDQQKSIIYSKRPTRTKRTKIESEPIHLTRHATKKQNQRQTRKRKQSISDDENNHNNNTVVLHKKKPIPPPAKTNTRKTRVRKPKEIPIREPSPLPSIDRSKHYSTHFSTRSHRLNNITLSTTRITDDDDNNNNNNKSKYSSTRLRTKSMIRTRSHDNDRDDQTNLKKRSNLNKNQTKKRAKSMMNTRNRRK
ncbi:unnamed protein product [Rotaria sordida]|uniref:Uncharacterized protein n=1 Tax=Rotaria sordida TaxID=392033 RepID=A0A818ZN04_9BILA|nr:unnamed protein product [Rotaria sordida]